LIVISCFGPPHREKFYTEVQSADKLIINTTQPISVRDNIINF